MNNEEDIRLLREDPDRLLVCYQPVIRLIVKSLAFKGFLPRREISDLVQDVNRKLLERMPRIRDQYNGTCQFKTYFSVVIRNLCMEEFRKVKFVAEPRAEFYETPASGGVTDRLVIRQELERLRRILRVFPRDEPALWLTLNLLADQNPAPEWFLSFPGNPDAGTVAACTELARKAIGTNRKDKYQILSELLTELGEKSRTAEAVCKWFESRMEEILRHLNGDPPRAAFTMDTVLILIEKGGDEEFFS